MLREPAPPLDAEKTSSAQVKENFRLPPDIEEEITRSTLIVGTRGSGKTMFLRRRKHLHPGFAAYGDLRKVLNSISNEIGGAGLTLDLPPASEFPIRAKTAALLAHWLAQQTYDRKLPLNWASLQRVLPRPLRSPDPSDAWEALSALAEELSAAPLSSFSNHQTSSAFEDFVEGVSATALSEAGSNLLLLLDRAEEIPYPGLHPILRLLDQSHSFLAVVAARPGILGPDHQLSSDAPIPGDHYNIRHLGSAPYSQDWMTFQLSALRAWLPITLGQIGQSELDWLLALSRDSVRHSLELLHNSTLDDGSFELSRAHSHVEKLRRSLLSACQGQLRPYNSDLHSLLSRLRKALPKLVLPLRLELPSQEQKSLTPPPVREMTKDEKFTHIGLRTGFLTTEHGVIWHPYSRLESVELPPIFLWKEGDEWSHIRPTA